MPLHHAARAGASVRASRSGTCSRALTPIEAAVCRLDDLFNARSIPGLTPRGYKVLRHLVEAADLRQPGAVHPTPSQTLQGLTGYSDRSVSGAHTDLVRAGLTERIAEMECRRDPVWHTRLTPHCMALLFANHSQEVAPPVDKDLNPIGGQGAAPPAPEDTPPNPEQPTPAEQPQGTVLHEGVHVPAVLAPLVPLLGGRRIRKAMSIAKAVRVRVEHVLAHRLERLRRARDPEGLLVHLIRSGEDWTRPVEPPKGTGGDAAAVDGPPVAAQDAAAKAFLAAHAGRWLARHDRTVVVEICASAAFDHRRVDGSWLRTEIQRPAMPALLQAVDAGRLEFLEVPAAAAILGDGEAKRQAFLDRQRKRRSRSIGVALA